MVGAEPDDIFAQEAAALPAEPGADIGEKAKGIDWREREVELALLGLLVKDRTLYHEVSDILNPDHLQHPEYKIVLTEFVGQLKDRGHTDIITLTDAVKGKVAAPEALLEKIAEESRVTAEPSELAERVKHYASRIREFYYQGALARITHDLGSKLHAGERTAVEGATELYRISGEVMRTLSKASQTQSMTEILHGTFAQIQDIHDRNSRLLGLSTSFFELDDLTGGLVGKNLYVVGGRPSMGKTSFQTNILENVALRENKPCLFFSLEMSKQEIAQRLLCSHARVDSNLLRSGRVSEEEFQKLVLAAGAFHESRIFINDDPLRIEEILRIARDYKQREDIALIGLDYLQKIKGVYGKGSSRDQDVGYVAGELKNMAKELAVPVLVTSQLNRDPENREDRKPMLSHLRESGMIEQEADVVMLLYREDYYNPSTEKKGVAELIIAKNRSGPVGTVELAFLQHYTRFENLAARPSY